MSFLALIPLRAWLIIGAVAALGGLLWHDHYLGQRLKARVAEITRLSADLNAERANRKTEQDDRRLADDIVTPVEIKVARIAATADPVGVYCRAPKLPSPAGKGGGAPGAADPTVDRGAEAPLRDIGSALGAARREAETNNARNEGLIKFEIERTH